VVNQFMGIWIVGSNIRHQILCTKKYLKVVIYNTSYGKVTVKSVAL